MTITFKRTLDDIIWQHIHAEDGVIICRGVKELGQSLHDAREFKNIAASNGFKTGCNASTVASMERGLDTVQAASFQKYADCLGFDLHFVLVDRSPKRIY